MQFKQKYRLAVLLIITILVNGVIQGQTHNVSNKEVIPCPGAPPEAQLKDLSKKAQDKVTSFFTTVSELGKVEKSAELKSIYIKNQLPLFVPNGTVEERSKYKKTGIIRSVADYLMAIKARGENTRIIVDYEITDPLLPNNLQCVKEGDQILLKGSITVRQYYCKLKQYAKPSDNFDYNAQCDYWDITDKKINIEMKLVKTINGYGWVVLIRSIVVLNVQ